MKWFSKHVRAEMIWENLGSAYIEHGRHCCLSVWRNTHLKLCIAPVSSEMWNLQSSGFVDGILILHWLHVEAQTTYPVVVLLTQEAKLSLFPVSLFQLCQTPKSMDGLIQNFPGLSVSTKGRGKNTILYKDGSA